MKPLFKNVLLRLLEEEKKTKSGFLIKQNATTVQKCEVLTVWDWCTEVKKWDKVLVMWYLLEVVDDIEKIYVTEENNLLSIIDE